MKLFSLKVFSLIALFVFSQQLAAQSRDYHDVINYPPTYFEASDFYPTKTQYSLKEIQAQLDKFVDSIANIGLDLKQERELEKLRSMLNPTPSVPRYKIVKSQGPKWKSRIVELIERYTDIHENLSYLEETWDEVIEYCKFKDVESNWDQREKDKIFVDMENYFFSWEEIKPTGGGESLAYVITLKVPLHGPDKSSAKTKKCEYPRSRWTVLNRDFDPPAFVSSEYYR